jgi:hypothetical protein
MEKYDNVKQNVKHVMDKDMGSYNHFISVDFKAFLKES